MFVVFFQVVENVFPLVDKGGRGADKKKREKRERGSLRTQHVAIVAFAIFFLPDGVGICVGVVFAIGCPTRREVAGPC